MFVIDGTGYGRYWVVERVPATLLAALIDLMKWLDATGAPSIIIGGVAASILGQPRLTQDVDALAILPEGQWTGAVSSAALYGILPRIESPVEFARRSREDLLIMKAVAGRPKDLQDIEGLLAAHPEADITTVRQSVSEFATALSTSVMLEEFDKLVARSKSKP